MNHIRRPARTALFTLLLAMLVAPLSGAAQTPVPVGDRVPVLAYYYIWFTQSSWDRAKTDLPLLGKYTSSDEEVMRQHVIWAKETGIDGFIVSWKHSDILSPRLATLVEIARDEDFLLAINYEGLDFYREPLPISRISSDLAWFATTYGKDPTFDIFGRPMVIWSGTWKFSDREIEEVTSPYRDTLLLLASERQPEDYEEIAHLVDGNAYYWSSVDPETFPDYPGKLRRMEDAVHSHGGLWVAPAAPGFDARHIGGEREVPRREGSTLATQFDAAMSSSPDAIGLISWNEFSENSHIEPSCRHGADYLEATARLVGGTSPTVHQSCDVLALATAQAAARQPEAEPTPTPETRISLNPAFEWDSSAPQGQADRSARMGTLTLLGLVAGLFGFSVIQVTRRALREEHGRRVEAISGEEP